MANRMTPGGADPYPNLTFEKQADWRHVNTSLLARLQQIAAAKKMVFDVTSGYRDPAYSASHGGFATDPHTRGLAVDVYANGQPIGNLFPPSFFSQYGIRSGNVPNFYQGKTDPEHLDLMNQAGTQPTVGGGFQQQAWQDAQRYGVDPNLFLRMIKQESGFNPNALSPAGAVGIAQIVPKWHPDVNPRDPRASLDWAARTLAADIKKYGVAGALSNYNSGNPRGYLSIPETKNYVNSILGGKNIPMPAGMTQGVTQPQAQVAPPPNFAALLGALGQQSQPQVQPFKPIEFPQLQTQPVAQNTAPYQMAMLSQLGGGYGFGY